MMKRRELREQVFRLLFRVSFYTAEDMKEQMLLWTEDLPAEDTQEAFKEKDIDYITTRCGKVQDKVAQIDPIINENTEGWNTERMGKVELTVLRLAVYEILFDDDIPASVAINEAVEIAKKYGQESSGAFVNAILGKVAKSDESKS